MLPANATTHKQGNRKAAKRIAAMRPASPKKARSVKKRHAFVKQDGFVILIAYDR